MSIFKDNKKIENIYKGTTKIGKIYKGSSLIYSAGYWLQKIGMPITLTNSLGKLLKKYKIYGNSEYDNLFNGTLYKTNGSTSKGAFIYSLTPVANNYLSDGVSRGIGQYCEVEPNTTYVFTYDKGGERNLLCGEYANLSDITVSTASIGHYTTTANTLTFTTTANTHYVVIAIWYYPTPAAGAVTFSFNNAVLTKIPTPTEPSEIHSLGENSAIEVKSTATNIMPTKTVLKDVYTGKAKLEKNKTYCISYDLVGATTYRIGFRLWVEGQQLIDNTSSGPKDFDYVYTSISAYWHPSNCYTWGSNYAITTYRSFTVAPKQDCEIDLKVWLGNTTATSSLDNIQIEESSTPTTYEPYQEPIITNIDLTGHDPLMKVGDYADYIDYENQQIVRQVKKHKLVSTDVLLIANVSTDYGRILYMTTDGVKNGYQPVLSTHFSYEGVALPPVGKININSNGVVLIGTDKTTVADFKTWLGSNDVYIYYPLNVPTTEPFVLNEIGTLVGNSIMSANDEIINASNLDITYKSKTSS